MAIYILGVSAFYHDSAACLIRDGKIIAAAQEERFTRKKHDLAFPHHAIKYCISEAQIKPSQITNIVFYEKTEGAVNINQVDKEFFNSDSISIFVGPVGGFSLDELGYFKDHDCVVINLGGTIFKSDTAAIISVSLIKFLIDGTFN